MHRVSKFFFATKIFFFPIQQTPFINYDKFCFANFAAFFWGCKVAYLRAERDAQQRFRDARNISMWNDWNVCSGNHATFGKCRTLLRNFLTSSNRNFHEQRTIQNMFTFFCWKRPYQSKKSTLVYQNFKNFNQSNQHSSCNVSKQFQNLAK